MLAPYAVGMTVLWLLPALAALPLALTDYDALSPPEWVGAANLAALAADEIFRTSVFNSLLYVALAVPLRLLGALGIALLLARKLWGGAPLRAVFYLPTVVPDIAWALVWLWLLNPIFGPVNGLLRLVSVEGPAWMVDPWGARFGVVLMMLWQIGEGLVICLAALADVPGETLEQAAVDGASTWGAVRSMTLPLIAPALLILLCRDTILSLQATFVPALILGNGGGPNYATTFLPMYAYDLAFGFFRFGYAAAVTWAMIALTGLLLWVQFRLARRWSVGL
jgi:multiple sugar transport system permease protein